MCFVCLGGLVLWAGVGACGPMMHHTQKRRNRIAALLVGVLLLAMTVLAFASVPLYRIFCQRTGYGGTPKIVAHGASCVIEREMTVRFSASVHRDLPWHFSPLQQEIKLCAGQTGLAFYQVKNRSSKPLVGIATYNVTPEKVGKYFNKIDCFCFEEQTLPPGQVIDMPVQFFIDPDIAKDPRMADIKTITLSYTFFNSKDPNIPEILGLPSLRRPH